jgi:hypothetical protein
MQAVLKAQINKTDRNDARGIAQMMRVGLYRPVHVKTLRSQKLRMLLTHRKLLQSKAIAIDNDLRGTLRNFGLKVGMVGTVKFEARIKELVENFPDLAVLIEPLLVVRRVLREQFVILHRRLLAIVRDDEVCRRLMTVPGVGPVVALTYRATVDVPARFRKSKAVGAVFGLTCSKYQSGEIDRSGRISRCGAHGRYCCKSLFSSLIMKFPGCRRDVEINMWGVTSSRDELTGDFGDGREAISIGVCDLSCRLVGKVVACILGLLQQNDLDESRQWGRPYRSTRRLICDGTLLPRIRLSWCYFSSDQSSPPPLCVENIGLVRATITIGKRFLF